LNFEQHSLFLLFFLWTLANLAQIKMLHSPRNSEFSAAAAVAAAGKIEGWEMENSGVGSFRFILNSCAALAWQITLDFGRPPLLLPTPLQSIQQWAINLTQKGSKGIFRNYI